MGATFTLRFEDLPKAIIDEMAGLVDDIPRIMVDAAEDCKTLAIDRTEETKSIDLGLFHSAWRVMSTSSGAILLNDAPHAVFVEEGRRPGKMPPFMPIFEWLARKKYGLGSIDATMTAGSYLPARFAEPELEKIRQHALGVARAIGARGTKPRRILGGLQKQFRAVVEENFKRALEEEG